MKKKGFTLIELTVVISVILILAGGSLFYTNVYRDYIRGVEAGLELKTIYSAQREYLADRPATDTSTFVFDTATNLRGYLPAGYVLPTVEALDGSNLTINMTLPPTFSNGGSIYDESRSRNDGIWDAGQ